MQMADFEAVRKAAITRLGGDAALKARLPKVASAKKLKAMDDAQYFSVISFRVFSAGLKRSMVEAKWPAFEEVFHGFEPKKVRAMSDEDLESLMNDSRIIRHWGKIRATHHNAAAMCDLVDEYGSFAAYITDWPDDNLVGLWEDMAKRFKQLGGRSAPMVLRHLGRDSHMPSEDTIRGLQHFGFYDGSGKGKKETRRIGDIIHAIAQANNCSLSEVSMTFATSCD